MEATVLQPERILNAIGITDTSVIADFGCGPGIFTIPAATMTRRTVHCFDVLPTALEAVASKARTLNLVNIATQRANLEHLHGSGLEDHSVDVVIMRKILCQGQNNKGLLAEAYRILRAGGKLLVIGWRATAKIGPNADVRISQEDVRELGVAAGFSAVQEIPVDEQHFALTLEK